MDSVDDQFEDDKSSILLIPVECPKTDESNQQWPDKESPDMPETVIAASQSAPRRQLTPEQAEARRKYAADYQRALRQNLTPEQTEERRKAAAQARREARQRETPEQTEARRKSMAAYQRAVRQNLSPAQLQQRQQADAQARREQRQRETPEQKEARRQAMAAYQRAVRQSLSPEELERRRQAEAQARREARQRETPEQTEARRQAMAAYQRAVRQSLSPEQLQQRQQADAQAHRIARQQTAEARTRESAQDRLYTNIMYPNVHNEVVHVDEKHILKANLEYGDQICSNHVYKTEPAIQIDDCEPNRAPESTLPVEHKHTSAYSSDCKSFPITGYDNVFAEGTCRSCSIVSPENVSIFQPGTMQLTSAGALLAQCLSINIHFGDGYPSSICQSCIKQLESFYGHRAVAPQSIKNETGDEIFQYEISYLNDVGHVKTEPKP